MGSRLCLLDDVGQVSEPLASLSSSTDFLGFQFGFFLLVYKST